MWCLKCNVEFDVKMDWETLGNTIVCANCKQKMEICYDEYYEEGMEEEVGWWYFENIEE